MARHGTQGCSAAGFCILAMIGIAEGFSGAASFVAPSSPFLSLQGARTQASGRLAVGVLGARERSRRAEQQRASAPAMLVEPATAIAAGSVFAGNSVILGGALAGGLHAVSGPDHFPALLPRCLGKPWLAAAKVGGLWGLGHALSAMVMGLVAFFIKEKSFTSSKWMAQLAFGVDIAIGLSLVVIGFLSLQEAKGRDFSADIKEASSEAQEGKEKQSAVMKVNMVINGIFHGLALDGIPTLMPVLGATSVSAAVSFLLSYGAGVIFAMTAATIFIGHGTRSIARNSDFDLGKLIRGSAFAAIAIGFAWSGRAIFFP